jgi:hypothetical protein
MAKLLLLSVVLMSVWLPVMTARDSNPRRGLRRMVHGLVLFNIFYVFAVLVIYPRLMGH